MNVLNDACEICGSTQWNVCYEGPIRDGAFGSLRTAGRVEGCLGCGVGRLARADRIAPSDYDSAAYRARLGQESELAAYRSGHDHMQKFVLEALWPRSLRGLTVADIGCGGGALLDLVKGVAARVIAVEPNPSFRASLAETADHVFPYASAAFEALGATVDLAFSSQVIEHVGDPVGFLKEIRALLKPEGLLLVSTPNHRDLLLDLSPDAYRSFFYRTVHNWYFDAGSLQHCAEHAGFEVVSTRYLHKYGLSNLLVWLRDRRPAGWAELVGIGPSADAFWRGYLEETGRADTIFMLLRRREAQIPMRPKREN